MYFYRNLQENPDPYNDNKSKSNNIKEQNESQIDDNFFEEEFDINLEELSKIEHLHSKDHKQPNIKAIKTETKIENFIDTNIVRKEDQSHKEEKDLDDDDCFLEMVYILMHLNTYYYNITIYLISFKHYIQLELNYFKIN